MTEQGSAAVEFTVRTIAETAVDREDEFGALDAVVGDGDLGFSLARGFEVVLANWDDYDRSDIGSFLRGVALAIASRVGGTSGPIWGSAFVKAAMVAGAKRSLQPQDVIAMLRAAIQGIKDRGRADLGDKTLLDALQPMTDALEAAVARGASTEELLDVAADTVRAAAEATSALQARRGRASYSGERSIGSPDAGAMAVAIIVEQIRRNWPRELLHTTETPTTQSRSAT